MTDLTLAEYRDVSEEELGQKLNEEARKMFGCGPPLENNLLLPLPRSPISTHEIPINFLFKRSRRII